MTIPFERRTCLGNEELLICFELDERVNSTRRSGTLFTYLETNYEAFRSPLLNHWLKNLWNLVHFYDERPLSRLNLVFRLLHRLSASNIQCTSARLTVFWLGT